MPINFLKKIIRSENINNDWIKVSPSDTCKNYIDGFYIFSCTGIKKQQLIFNDGLPAIILLPDSNDQVSIQTDRTQTVLQSAWVNGGVIKNSYVNYLDKIDYILVIRFKPVFFYRLFNLSPLFFKNKSVVSLTDIHFDIALLNSLFAETAIDKRIALFESFIAGRPVSNQKMELLDYAIDHINNTRGQTTVSEVMQKTGVNYKWIERNFLNYLGLTPKEYIQLQRFIAAYIHFTDSGDKNLMEIAITNGYYDYNHFIKEFKSYTGKTPFAYLNG